MSRGLIKSSNGQLSACIVFGGVKRQTRAFPAGRLTETESCQGLLACGLLWPLLCMRERERERGRKKERRGLPTYLPQLSISLSTHPLVHNHSYPIGIM